MTSEAGKEAAGPYSKIYHRASKVNAKGGVSALCFKTPHAINLSKALWTIRDEAVTCPKCRAIINARAALASAEPPPDLERAVSLRGEMR